MVGQYSDLVVAQIPVGENGKRLHINTRLFFSASLQLRILQSGKCFQVADAIGMYHRDFVRLEVQLRRFGRDGFGDFLQLVAGATHHRAGAGAGRRAVTLAETALIHVGGALKVKVWQILDRHVAHLRRGSTTGRRAIQLLLAQPVREPGKMAVAPERIRGKISGKERRNMF